MSDSQYKLVLSQARQKGRLGLEGVVSVFKGDALVDEDLVNLSQSENRKSYALTLSERFGIDMAEEKLLALGQTARQQLESAGEHQGDSQGTQLVELALRQGTELWPSAESDCFATAQLRCVCFSSS